MGKARGKARKARAQVDEMLPASLGLADAANDFAVGQVVEAGQTTRAKVYRRRDQLDELHNRSVINGEGWQVLYNYRSTWEKSGFDRSRSCLDDRTGGKGEGASPQTVAARRAFASMRYRVRPILRATLDAIALDNMSLEQVAATRGLPQRSPASRYVTGRTRFSAGKIGAVATELRGAIEDLMRRPQISA